MTHNNQSRRMSLIESITNVTIGYGIALVTQLIVFPIFGLAVSFGDNLMIAFIFTTIAVVRNYLVRRMFEGWNHGHTPIK